MGSGNSKLYSGTSGTMGIISEEFFMIGRSLGAAAMNYDVRDPETGRKYKFAEGTRVSDIETFAGKGTRKPLKPNVVDALTERYGGKRSDWKHSKGIGTLDRGGRWQTAEVHWFENDGIRTGFKIKKWM